MSPYPTPPDCSATPKHARILVTYCPAELMSSGRMAAGAVLDQ